MAGQFATLQVLVSFTAQSMLGRSPTEAFRLDVLEEMLTEFQEQAEQRHRLKSSGIRICDLILELPSGQVRLANRVDEVLRRLQVKQAEHREMDIKREGLWSSIVQIWDLVLGGPDGTSSLASSLSSATELVEGCIDVMTSNRVSISVGRHIVALSRARDRAGAAWIRA
jgi:hypothetical protein